MHRQSGFSLLEVMVAGVIAVLGLAGLAALMMNSLAQTAGARDRAIALGLVMDVTEVLMVEPGLLAAFEQVPPDDPVATARQRLWQDRLRQELGDGELVLCRDATPLDGGPGDPACDGLGELVVKALWPGRGATADWQQVSRVVNG